MKVSKKAMITSILLCLLPIVFGLIIWKDLPAKVPTHFDLNNKPDAYSSKAFAVFGLPLVMAGLDALCLFGLNSDPKADKHSKVLDRIMLWFIPGLSCIIQPMCLLAALGKEINIALFCQLLAAVIFIIAGNYLPKCRQNYTMGIKLPWTLHSEDNWNYTHRLGGFLWVIAGLILFINAFFGNFLVMLITFLLSVLIPVAASYIYYLRHKN